MGLEEALGRADAGVGIATSRFGEALTTTRLPELAARVERAGATVAFGSPGRGLPAILGDGVDADADAGVAVEPGADGNEGPGFDLWLNTIPRQGSETVRTEEAVFATLAPLTLTE
jgi:predicted SPOUT superfamily RNA methylase MTH1